MWNFYSRGENYYGYNIKFHADNLKSCLGHHFANIVNVYKVICNDEDKEKLVKDAILEEYSKRCPQDAIKTIESSLSIYKFLFKNKCFEYEKEWRLIVNIDCDDQYRYINIDNYKNHFTLGASLDEFYLINNICVGPLNDNKIVNLGLRQYLTENAYDYFLEKINNSQIPLRGK